MSPPRLALLSLLLAGSVWRAEAASVSSGWEAISIPQEQCLSVGFEALRRQGYSNLHRDAVSVYGWQRNDNIAVRCIAERGVVVLFAYVFEGDTSLSAARLDAVRQAFQRRGPK